MDKVGFSCFPEIITPILKFFTRNQKHMIVGMIRGKKVFWNCTLPIYMRVGFMVLNRVLRQEWFHRFSWFLASLIENGRTSKKLPQTCYSCILRLNLTSYLWTEFYGHAWIQTCRYKTRELWGLFAKVREKSVLGFRNYWHFL